MVSEAWVFQSRIFGKVASKSSLLRQFALKRYEQHFATVGGGGMFHGVYDSFASAARMIPQEKLGGYDNAEAGQMYRDRLTRVFPSDYPVLFWLRELLPQVKKVFDLGGHVGIARYAYAQYLRFSDGFPWLVYDVPAVVEAGKRLAAERGVAGLEFTTDLSRAAEADLLFSAGALQYVDDELPEILGRLEKRPKYLLLNLLPLSDQPTYFTLQHLGNAVCPYGIHNRERLASGLARLGYQLRDQWENPEKSCHIPLHLSHSLDHYDGMLWVRQDA
jgi:putative methyltransferase (TIGR04325 family)